MKMEIVRNPKFKLGGRYKGTTGYLEMNQDSRLGQIIVLGTKRISRSPCKSTFLILSPCAQEEKL